MSTIAKQRLVLLVLYLCLLYLKVYPSLAVHTINENQSLCRDQTVASAGGIFELGFFQSSESKTSIWSANWTSSSTSASIHSLLLDSGNFVLLKAGSTSEFLWQSFDFPTHTWLPGSRLGFSIVSQQTQILTSWKSYEDPAPGLFSLNPGSTANHMLWNRSTQYWTSGLWNESSNSFSLVPEMRLSYVYNFSYGSNKNEGYFTYSLYDPKRIARFVLSTSGQVSS
ncbi:hypothetical protein DVH24_028245 [Malus domestica]|uniref:Bulb-type lectin domain-containing protein n=1 Tax=Malus domestica TaxID=3750 RepID=A0A498H9H3_MALDO|nr:hypothetical protein DVH24_028245 [Malus domestica]